MAATRLRVDSVDMSAAAAPARKGHATSHDTVHRPKRRPFATASITWAGGQALQVEEGRALRCAMVGSGGNLKGRSRGADIDAHDLVARLNRLPVIVGTGRDPSAEQPPNQTEADLGKRTDILFVAVPDLPEVSRGRVVAEGLRPQRPVGGAGLRPIAASCSLRSASNWTCPFRAYVAACFEPHAQATFTAAATGEVALALGCVRPPIISESRRFEALRLRDGRVRPSSGFMLFLALVHQCDHLSLYGFDDRLTTMDGHFLSPSHRLVSEHLAMRTILEYERTRAAAIGLRNRSFAIE